MPKKIPQPVVAKIRKSVSHSIWPAPSDNQLRYEKVEKRIKKVAVVGTVGAIGFAMYKLLTAK